MENLTNEELIMLCKMMNNYISGSFTDDDTYAVELYQQKDYSELKKFLNRFVLIEQTYKATKRQMDEDKLWDMVHKCEWKKDNDYDRISVFLNSTYTKEEIEELESFVAEKTHDLHVRFEKDWLDPQNGINVSDDGWMDLTSEVVGRGKEFYNSITADKLRQMADEDDYEENFSYSFH